MWWARFVFGLAVVLGLLLPDIPGIIFLILNLLLEAIVVREGLTELEANQRAFDLTKRNFWALTGYLAVLV